MANIHGLTSAEAAKSAKEHGTNALTPRETRTFWQTYWSNYDDPIITVLLIALGINILFTFFGKVDWHECLGILLSIIISTFVSALSEHSNENTFNRLREEASATRSKVYRDGKLCEIKTAELVIGDAVLLQGGDLVPADGSIISGSVKIDQSPLNGESEEIEKHGSGHIPKPTAFNDFWNSHSVFRGSVVCSGEAVMHIDTVGDDTVYGRLTHEAQEESLESPLSVKLMQLAKSISRFGCISAVLIVIISFINNAFLANELDPVMIAGYFSDGAQVASDLVSSLIIGIIVIVVAVPEGLPLMIAIVCSLNMKKMLKAKVLVRRLIGIETAGGINILFTDKTGTITCGKPKVTCVFDGSGREYKAFGALGGLKAWFSLSAAANSSARYSGKDIIGGNATEKAILEFVGRRNAALGGAEVLSFTPFSSEKKFSAATVNNGRRLTLIKGAPEKLLPRCRYYIDSSGEKQPFGGGSLNQKAEQAAAKKMRLLALAVYDGIWDGAEPPEGMTLIAAAAIRDDVRPEAKAAIADVTAAGIQVVMITGDRAETAEAIAAEAGLLDNGGRVITSARLGEMSDAEVRELLPSLRVVARALPGDKSRLVRIAQGMGLVVGMTGDGVNDAPALKLADVGFAMGGGAEAAAAAADIVILDDNFKSVRNAVLYGRTIYNSIKKFIRFQLTINVAAVTVSMLGPIVGVEKPLDISQMIWTNLMIDSLAAIAFGGEPALKRYLRERPHRRDEPIIDREMWNAIIVDGIYICALSLIFFISPVIRSMFRPSPTDIYFYTGYFTFFIFISVFNAFNARCDGLDLLENISLNKQFLIVMFGIMSVQVLMTYFGGNILRTAGLNIREWTAAITAALTIFPVELIRKIITGRIFAGGSGE